MATIEQLTRDILAAVQAEAATHDDEHLDIQERVNALITRIGHYEVPDLSGTAAQNRTALNTAIADGRTSGRPVHLGLCDAQVDGPIDAGATSTVEDAPKIRGVSTKHSRITCTDNAAVLMYHGGFRGWLKDFKMQHLGDNPDGTFGNGLVWRKSAWCEYSNLGIDNCKSSIKIEQAAVNDPGSSSGGGNWAFSNYHKLINVNRYSESGLFLRAFTGRATGSVWDTIYVQNKTPAGAPRTSTESPVDLFLLEDSVFNQLNIEDHLGVSIGLLANSGGTITFNSLHFERVTLDGFNSQYVRAFGDCNVIINGLNIAFCDIAGPNATGHSRMASASTGGRVDVRGASVNHLTRTKTNVSVPWYRIAAGNADDSSAEYTYEVELLHATTPTTFDGDSDNTTDSGLKRVGDSLYGLNLA